MHIEQTTIHGEDFIGLFGFATDRYAILSRNFGKISVLDVPIIRTDIYGTNLIGMFCAGNSNGLLLPYFVSDRKIEEIRKELGESGINIEIGKILEKYTAIGNLICCNDNSAIISPKLSSMKIVEDILDVEIIQREISKHEEVGSCCVVTNKGFLIHPDGEKELDEISEIFRVKGDVGSVNFGFPFVRSGIIANSNGYITGSRTTGIEIGRIDKALGFLD